MQLTFFFCNVHATELKLIHSNSVVCILQDTAKYAWHLTVRYIIWSALFNLQVNNNILLTNILVCSLTNFDNRVFDRIVLYMLPVT